jgi:hypothetical protein
MVWDGLDTVPRHMTYANRQSLERSLYDPLSFPVDEIANACDTISRGDVAKGSPSSFPTVHTRFRSVALEPKRDRSRQIIACRLAD